MHVTRKTGPTLATLSLIGLAAAPTQAQITTYITDFAKSGNIQNILNPSFPSGLFTPAASYPASAFNTPFDITSDASGNNFAQPGNGQTLTIAVGVADVTNVYTLLNAAAPTPGVASTSVEFIGSAGADETFTLVNGTDIRDFFQGAYANTINGTTTKNAFSVVNTGGTGAPYSGTFVVDAQDFVLAPAFASQTLDTIRITNTQQATGGPLLLGVTTQSLAPATAVPEPSTLAVLSAGLLPIGIAGLRRRLVRQFPPTWAAREPAPPLFC